VEQGRVRIGVIAPRDTTVLREELVAPKPAVAEKP
jgi:sRNA-binding carbon storage regulator CsrA